jgi:hypothetical protein
MSFFESMGTPSLFYSLTHAPIASSGASFGGWRTIYEKGRIKLGSSTSSFGRVGNATKAQVRRHRLDPRARIAGGVRLGSARLGLITLPLRSS